MSVVVFDPELFRAMYPACAAMSDTELAGFFTTATLLVSNRESSRIPYNPPETIDREVLLYAATCHMAELATRGSGAVGRVASAGEGSVNTALTMGARNNASWWEQTQCGATVWQLLLPYRMGGRYVSGC